MKDNFERDMLDLKEVQIKKDDIKREIAFETKKLQKKLESENNKEKYLYEQF